MKAASVVQTKIISRSSDYYNTVITSVQAGAVLCLSPCFCFRSKVLECYISFYNEFYIKLAYLYKVTEKKRLIYMHLLLLLFIVLCGLPGPQERRKN